MVGGTIRREVIHRESFRALVLHLSESQAVLQSIAQQKCLLTTPSFLSTAPTRQTDPPTEFGSRKVGQFSQRSSTGSGCMVTRATCGNLSFTRSSSVPVTS